MNLRHCLWWGHSCLSVLHKTECRAHIAKLRQIRRQYQLYIKYNELIDSRSFTDWICKHLPSFTSCRIASSSSLTPLYFTWKILLANIWKSKLRFNYIILVKCFSISTLTMLEKYIYNVFYLLNLWSYYIRAWLPEQFVCSSALLPLHELPGGGCHVHRGNQIWAVSKLISDGFIGQHFSLVNN